MPTYTNVTVGTDAGSWDPRQQSIVRQSTGRIWTAWFDASDRRVYAAYSDDDGDTWETPVEVRDPGGTGHDTNVSMYIDTDDNVWLSHYDDTVSNDPYYLYKYDSGWSLIATVDSVNGSSGRGSMRFVFPATDTIYFFYNSPISGGQSAIYYKKSTNGGSSFGSGVLMQTFVDGGTDKFHMDDNGAFYCGHDGAGTVHIFCGDVATGGYGIWHGELDTSDDSSTWEEVYALGGTSNNEHPRYISYAEDSNGDLHLIWSVEDSGDSAFNLYYSKKNGSWSTPTRPYGSSQSSNQINGGIGLNGDDPYILWEGIGWDTQTADYDLQYIDSDDGGATWNSRVAITDVSDHRWMSSILHVPGITQSQCTAGFMACYHDETSNNWAIVYSSDIAFGTADITGTGSEVLTFSEEASIQRANFEQIDSDTTTVTPYGGRQALRGPNGERWVTYRNSTGVCVALKEEGGSWAETTIVNNASNALALCMGEDGYPVLGVSFNDKIKVYQYNGTSWVTRESVTTASTTESFQLLYDGSTYHVLYGDVSGSGTRRVRHRTSSDLSSAWGSATNVETSGATGRGPQNKRALAACLDSGGDIHVVYNIKVSGTHTLRHAFYNGSWGSPTTIQTANTGDNANDYCRGVSIAIDLDDNLHAAWLRYNDSFTNRMAVWYSKFNVSWETAEQVSESTWDADQNEPDIAVNNTTPTIYWQAAGGETDIVSATSTESWQARSLVDGNADVHVVHGPDAFNYQTFFKGFWFSYKGSQEWAEATLLVGNDQANASDVLTFTEVASLQGFPIAEETITFTETASAETSVTAADTLTFSESANLTLELSAADTLTFSETAIGNTGDVFGVEFLFFTEEATRETVPLNGVGEDILTFTEIAALEREVSASEVLEFTEDPTVVSRRNVDASETLTFTESPSEIAILNLTISETLTFTEGAHAFKPSVDFCDDDFTPEFALPAQQNEYVYFMGPWPALTLTVRMRAPSFGDLITQNLQVVVNRSKSGTKFVHTRDPLYETLNLQFDEMTDNKWFEFRNFLRQTRGQQIRYIDDYGHLWLGVILSSTAPFGRTSQARTHQTSVTVLFEGERIGAVSV